MSVINNILTYSSLFGESKETIEYLLSCIDRNTLLQYSARLLHLSSRHSYYTDSNILRPFLGIGEQDLCNFLFEKIQQINHESGVSSCIINTRASLDFFTYSYNSKTNYSTVAESQRNINVLKAYLLVNERHHFVNNNDYSKTVEEIFLGNALINERYINENLFYLRLAQIIKACLFFEFSENKLHSHLNEFEVFYNISSWKQYVRNIHEVGKLLIDDPKDETSFFTISIPIDDDRYLEKKKFLELFCMQQSGWDNNQDYTLLKNNPIIQIDDNEYIIIFEQFFCEKTYQSLYFKFNEINNSLKAQGSQHYIANFRSYIGYEFSEKILTNKLIVSAFGNKYIHLDYRQLQDGDIDHYVRNGKYIFLFECKDNLISKDILDECNLEKFIQKLKDTFLETVDSDKKTKSKAINQLVRNIQRVLDKNCADKNYKSNNCVIYPIVVSHNNIFSLSGVNAIINEWFREVLFKKGIRHPYIKDLTIISIDTLVVFQGLFAQKGNSLKDMIDRYWTNYYKIEGKLYPTAVNVVEDYPEKYQSFKKFIEVNFYGKDLFTKEICQYSNYFTDSSL